MINHGANVNDGTEKNWSNRTFLHRTILSGIFVLNSLSFIGFFILSRRELEFRKNLHFLFIYTSTGTSDVVQIIELLIKNGANVNALDEKLNTPLHCIAFVDEAEQIDKMSLDDEISNSFCFACKRNYILLSLKLVKKGSVVKILFHWISNDSTAA